MKAVDQERSPENEYERWKRILTTEDGVLDTMFSPTGPIQAVMHIELLVKYIELHSSNAVRDQFDLRQKQDQERFKLFVYYILASPKLNLLKVLNVTLPNDDQVTEHPFNIDNCYSGMQIEFMKVDIAVAQKTLVDLLDIYDLRLIKEDVYIAMASHFTTLLARFDMVGQLVRDAQGKLDDLPRAQADELGSQAQVVKQKLNLVTKQLQQLINTYSQKYIQACLATLRQQGVNILTPLAQMSVAVRSLRDILTTAEGNPEVTVDCRELADLFTALDITSYRLITRIQKRDRKIRLPSVSHLKRLRQDSSDESESIDDEASFPKHKEIQLIYDNSQSKWMVKGVNWHGDAVYTALESTAFQPLHELIGAITPNELSEFLQTNENEVKVKALICQGLGHVCLHNINFSNVITYLKRDQLNLLTLDQIKQREHVLKAAIDSDDEKYLTRVLGEKTPTKQYDLKSELGFDEHTPLTYAALALKYTAVAVLVRAGANVNHVESNNRTALQSITNVMLLNFTRYCQMACVLLTIGATIPDELQDLYHQLSANGLVVDNTPCASQARQQMPSPLTHSW